MDVISIPKRYRIHLVDPYKEVKEITPKPILLPNNIPRSINYFIPEFNDTSLLSCRVFASREILTKNDKVHFA